MVTYRYFIYCSCVSKDCSSFRIFEIHMIQVPNIFIDPIKSKQVELSYILSGLYYQTKGLYHLAKKLWKRAKEKGYKFDITDVKKWLSRQDRKSTRLNSSHS